MNSSDKQAQFAIAFLKGAQDKKKGSLYGSGIHTYQPPKAQMLHGYLQGWIHPDDDHRLFLLRYFHLVESQSSPPPPPPTHSICLDLFENDVSPGTASTALF